MRAACRSDRGFLTGNLYRLAVGRRLQLWLRRAATRKALAELEPHYLTDIGLDERQRSLECAKWFWQR